jgi:hypothetical protein
VVKDEIFHAIGKTVIGHGDVAGDLLHPLLVWIGSDAGDLNLSAADVDEKPDIICNDAVKRPDFLGEEIAGDQDILVRGDEVLPTRAFLTLRCR